MYYIKVLCYRVNLSHTTHVTVYKCIIKCFMLLVSVTLSMWQFISVLKGSTEMAASVCHNVKCFNDYKISVYGSDSRYDHR